MGTTLYGDPALSLYPISNPPSKPNTPDGPNSGRIKLKHTYTTSCIDPNNDQTRYLFDWGDGNTTITEYYPSGEIVGVSYTWNKQGTFNIRVRAQDENGAWSEWSDFLPVSMPNNKPTITLDYLEIFQKSMLKISNYIQNIFL
ncbi:PKD domain-containing protein [Thermoplasmatota archaeon]